MQSGLLYHFILALPDLEDECQIEDALDDCLASGRCAIEKYHIIYIDTSMNHSLWDAICALHVSCGMMDAIYIHIVVMHHG